MCRFFVRCNRHCLMWRFADADFKNSQSSKSCSCISYFPVLEYSFTKDMSHFRSLEVVRCISQCRQKKPVWPEWRYEQEQNLKKFKSFNLPVLHYIIYKVTIYVIALFLHLENNSSSSSKTSKGVVTGLSPSLWCPLVHLLGNVTMDLEPSVSTTAYVF